MHNEDHRRHPPLGRPVRLEGVTQLDLLAPRRGVTGLAASVNEYEVGVVAVDPGTRGGAVIATRAIFDFRVVARHRGHVVFGFPRELLFPEHAAERCDANQRRRELVGGHRIRHELHHPLRGLQGSHARREGRGALG